MCSSWNIEFYRAKEIMYLVRRLSACLPKAKARAKLDFRCFKSEISTKPSIALERPHSSTLASRYYNRPFHLFIISVSGTAKTKQKGKGKKSSKPIT